MNTGMLWFDNDPKADLAIKIQRAADYYRQKYGETPDLCFVHPSMVGAGPAVPGQGQAALQAGKIEVRTNRSILPHHFWIGIHSVAVQGVG